MPNGAATASMRSTSSTGSRCSPSKETGTPRSKPTACEEAGSRTAKALRVSTQASSASGSVLPSVSRPPMVVPQRPRLIE